MRYLIVGLMTLAIICLLTGLALAEWFYPTGQAAGDLYDNSATCAWGDYDNDGDQDLFVGVNTLADGSHLWRNDNGVFVDRADQAGVLFEGKQAWSSCWGDYDNDGFLDLYVAAGFYSGSFENVLYHNQGPDPQTGEYTFEPITDVVGGSEDTRGAIWGDFNNDGLLDLYIANKENNVECKMFRNTGSTTPPFFEDQICVPREIQPAEGAVAGDIDNDGDLDIYVVNDRDLQGNRLYRNKLIETGTEWLFVDEADDPILLDNVRCQSASFCDFDFDGDLDLFVTTGPSNYLFRNDGLTVDDRVIWEDVSVSNGVRPPGEFGAAWGDFDLDGDFDLFAISLTGNDYFWVNGYRQGEPFFDNQIGEAGIGGNDQDLCTEWADFNADGKPDIFKGVYIDEQYCVLYQNIYNLAPSNRYLAIRLIGAESNRSAIGAHVVLRYFDGFNQTQQMAEISGGGTGSGSQGSLPLEFGVREATSIDSVLVYWPSGDTSIFEDVAVNQRITIVEHGGFTNKSLVWDSNIYGHYYVSGNIDFSHSDLTITEGTHIYFHKTWRTNETARLLISLDASLTIDGSNNLPVILTSQYASPEEGDWAGIQTKFNSNEIFLNYCEVSYAETGFKGLLQFNYRPSSIDIFNCDFLMNSQAGIDLYYPSRIAATQILTSHFENCGKYGIRIRKDIEADDPEMIIQSNTIKGCINGIVYAGNSNSSYTKIPKILNCILTYSDPSPEGYGIYVETYSGPYLASPQISGDSIVGFYAGIKLNSVGSHGELRGNKVKHNKMYGLYLANSSPRIHGNEEYFNSFSFNSTGIFLDQHSSPYVRWTQIKENNKYGVLSESDTQSDFGRSNDWGNNSIDMIFLPSTGYRDMKNAVASVLILAEYNWWGERIPDPMEIEGNIDYLPALGSDPLPILAKRSVEFTNLPSKLSVDQNLPNPFNPTTAISLYLEEPGQASLKVYNLQGQLVKTLISGDLDSGQHTVTWNATNNRGDDVASGIYFYVLSTEYGKTSKRMTLLR